MKSNKTEAKPEEQAEPKVHPYAGRDPKILLFDIETAPNLGYTWGKYEQTILGDFVQESYFLSFAYKWLGDKTVKVKALKDYAGYDPLVPDDKALVQDLWELFDQADIIIAHNGDKFDIKKANTRFIFHEMEPPGFYRTVDTLKMARRHFAFSSNRLDDLGKFLKVGKKVATPGISLWFSCMVGDPTAWALMCKYNKQDVALLEQVYYKLRSWAVHPNLNSITGRGVDECCSKCGSSNVIKRGTAFTNVSFYQRWFCKDCRSYSAGKHIKAHP